MAQSHIPSFLQPIFWIERVAVGIHFIEGLIAAFYAKRNHKAAIPTGIYTFFVGTIGLVELFTTDQVGDQTGEQTSVELTPHSLTPEGSIAAKEGEC